MKTNITMKDVHNKKDIIQTLKKKELGQLLPIIVDIILWINHFLASLLVTVIH